MPHVEKSSPGRETSEPKKRSKRIRIFKGCYQTLEYSASCVPGGEIVKLIRRLYNTQTDYRESKETKENLVTQIEDLLNRSGLLPKTTYALLEFLKELEADTETNPRNWLDASIATRNRVTEYARIAHENGYDVEKSRIESAERQVMAKAVLNNPLVQPQDDILHGVPRVKISSLERKHAGDCPGASLFPGSKEIWDVCFLDGTLRGIPGSGIHCIIRIFQDKQQWKDELIKEEHTRSMDMTEHSLRLIACSQTLDRPTLVYLHPNPSIPIPKDHPVPSRRFPATTPSSASPPWFMTAVIVLALLIIF